MAVADEAEDERPRCHACCVQWCCACLCGYCGRSRREEFVEDRMGETVFGPAISVLAKGSAASPLYAKFASSFEDAMRGTGGQKSTSELLRLWLLSLTETERGSIRKLDLEGAEDLTDAGLRALGAGCPHLTKLTLSCWDKTTPAGRHDLEKAIPGLTIKR